MTTDAATRPALRGRARRVIELTFCVLPALLVYGCQSQATPTLERPPAPVTVVPAVERDVPVYLDAVGKCVASEVVSVQSQVRGRITAIHFVDGADVSSGDLLFTIDPRPFEAELQRAQANLAKDTAMVKEAEARLARDVVQAENGDIQAKRYEELLKRGTISKERYDQVRTEAEALRATVAADKAALASARQAIEVDTAAVESAKLQLNYCYIKSPIRGRAGRRLADIGNVVSDSSDPILVIQRLEPIYADFSISENDLTAVQRDMKRGALQVEVRLPDETGAPLAGRLTYLDNAVRPDTGTVMLRATVPNPERRLWPGRFVNVRLILTTLQHAVLVPAAAPQMSAKGPFVYVVGADETAQMRPVRTGQRQGALVVIDEGLRPGERVVVRGQIGVTPGGKVLVSEASDGGENPNPAGDQR